MAAATAGGRVAAHFDDKLRRGLAGRRDLGQRLARWGASRRDRRRPLVWFHAPSVGEGLQTRPVIERLRAERPDWQLVYTFFSPSAAAFAQSLPVDLADYLPLDRPEDVAGALNALAPTALVYGKLDVWPELTLAAQARGVRLGLLAAAVAAASSRLAWPVRAWSAPAYAALDRIAAVSAEDAGRLVRLGARQRAITVTGDTRYDSVSERAARLDRSKEPFAALARTRASFTIVAGSTWPADEAVLVPAFADFQRHDPGEPARLILVPHEPTSEHLTHLDSVATAAGLPRPTRSSDLDSGPAATGTFFVVDQIGVLADLYALGDVAYVGGGYHRAGLHSVLEPAVFGVPISVGPRWQSSRDAALLIERGAAHPLPPKGRVPLAAQWRAWRKDAAGREQAGQIGRAVVDEGNGATSRTTALVRLLIEGAV